MNRAEKAAVGVLGSTFGGAVMAFAIKDSLFRVDKYFTGLGRDVINRSCHSTLSEDQFRRFIRTKEWLSFRKPLLHARGGETFKRLWGPISLFYGASIVASFSIDIGVAAILGEDLTSNPALAGGAFLFTVGALGRILFFKKLESGFIKFEVLETVDGQPVMEDGEPVISPIKPAYDSDVCVQARAFSVNGSGTSPSVEDYRIHVGSDEEESGEQQPARLVDKIGAKTNVSECAIGGEYTYTGDTEMNAYLETLFYFDYTPQPFTATI